MAFKSKKGFYSLVNAEKFVKPADGFMQSFNESNNSVEYKSRLELNSFRFCDANPNIVSWSVEYLHIPYLSPKDNKIHRYFPDLFIMFSNKEKFIVEVKSSGETVPPVKPKKLTKKTEYSYRKAVQTWLVNSAKWKACGEWCKNNGFKFIFLTEKELNS